VTLVLVIVLAVLGVFVAFFFGTIILQKVIQRHMFLLAKRAEAQRIVVRDLRHVDPAIMQLLSNSPGLVQDRIQDPLSMTEPLMPQPV